MLWKRIFFSNFSELWQKMLIALICRTLNVAKAVMKENKYVRDKKDNIIYLKENEKLQEVSCIDKRGKNLNN